MPRVPDIVLERYRLNELPRDQADRLTDLIRRDEGLQKRLEALARSDDELGRTGSLDRVAASVRERLESPTPLASSRPATRFAMPAAALVAVAAAIVLAVRLNAPVVNQEEGDRIKGLQPSLTVYRQTDRGSEMLADGAVAHRGDVVRLGYRAAGHPYGAILSIDGRGSVTVHLPAAGDRAAALEQGSPVLLDRAFELDDAPRFERFYFIVGESSFALEPVLEAVRTQARKQEKAAALSLPRGLEHSTFDLEKEITP
jgi:hypothetical protein